MPYPKGGRGRLFDVAADRAARGGGPDQLRRNLAGCCPRRLRRCRTISCAQACVPTPATGAKPSGPTMDPVRLVEEIESSATGLGNIHEAVERGRGAVLALHHSGNWDMAGVWIARRVGPPVVVAERLRPESLYRRFVRFREGLGFEIIPLTGSAQPPFEQQ
ncbi:hypothetical protein GS584_23195 [Rhodococcus hoagii]|nr:hypothetical protein [Prescottella equi]